MREGEAGEGGGERGREGEKERGREQDGGRQPRHKADTYVPTGPNRVGLQRANERCRVEAATMLQILPWHGDFLKTTQLVLI